MAIDPLNIVVTGATGLVGRQLVRRLKTAKHHVVALVRDPSRADLEAEMFAWDGKTPPPPESLRGANAIIHLAGENIAGAKWSKERKEALYDSRVKSAQALAQGLKNIDHKLDVFITASGIGYYGDRGNEVLTEDSRAGADFLGMLCQDWEAAADAVPAKRVVKLRFGVVFSRGGGFLDQVIPMFKKFGASRLGNGKHWLSWIHIEDLLRLLLRSLEDAKLSGPVNAVSPNPVTNSEMTKVLGEIIGARSGPPAPGFMIKLLYGELAKVMLASQKADPARLSSVGFTWKHPELREALESVLVERGRAPSVHV